VRARRRAPARAPDASTDRPFSAPADERHGAAASPRTLDLIRLKNRAACAGNPLHLRKSPGHRRARIVAARGRRRTAMTADSLMVLALMLGFLSMVGVGVWAGLEDETRAAVHAVAGRLAIGLGAAIGLLVVVTA
jgi:hypothetical protein